MNVIYAALFHPSVYDIYYITCVWYLPREILIVQTRNFTTWIRRKEGNVFIHVCLCLAISPVSYQVCGTPRIMSTILYYGRISVSNRSSKIKPYFARKPINFNAILNQFMSVLPNCSRYGYFLKSLNFHQTSLRCYRMLCNAYSS